MAPARRNHTQEDAIVASILASPEQGWDSSPLKLPGWFAHLQRAIPRERAAFDALQAAVARKVDVVICDTAGRLQAQKTLMDELGKVVRVMGKALPGDEGDMYRIAGRAPLPKPMHGAGATW